MKKIIAFALIILIVCSSVLFASAHQYVLDIEYDLCVPEKDTSGTDEIWYKIDKVNGRLLNCPVHLSDTTIEILYYFSPTADGDTITWIDFVKQAAEENEDTLTDSQINLYANKIKQMFADSMKKWQGVYYYLYENAERIPKQIISIEETNISSANLIIYPFLDTSESSAVASTTYPYPANYEYPNGHFHVPKYMFYVNVYDYYRAVINDANTDPYLLTMIKENGGAHEIGHVLGLGDLDIWCESDCLCVNCTDENANNDCKGHHEEALMGYGEIASRVTHITYKDIAGVSITRGFHDDDDHLWMVRENMNSETNEIESYDVICALCNGVRYDIDLSDEEYSNINDYVYKSCVHHNGNNEEMILVATDGERNFYKCRYCRYIEEIDIVDMGDVPLYETLNYSTSIAESEEKYYRFNLSDTTTYNFKAINTNNITVLLQDEHFNAISDITNSISSSNGYSTVLEPGIYHLYVNNTTSAAMQLEFTISPPAHTHSFNTWVSISSTKHIKACDDCGEWGTEEGVHVVKVGAGRFKPCLVCGYMVDTNFGIGEVGPFSITMVTPNGSYIMPSGIIVLVEEDVEAYLNGTLVFYDKDKLPVTQ